tara:strand:+ start:38754 stop:38966 length:213 start_codon:yes stop_codon:yes gene_type:complete
MKAQYEIPSRNLLVRVRAEFILQGSSFNAWCKANGVVRRTAEQSLTGEIQSDNAKRLVQTILESIQQKAA